jgi:hypothetical protein
MSLCPSLRREKKIILSYLFLLKSRNTYIHTHILAPINFGIQQIPTHLQKTKPAYNEINTLDNIWKLAHLKKRFEKRHGVVSLQASEMYDGLLQRAPENRVCD